jgi:hypothetical protein
VPHDGLLRQHAANYDDAGGAVIVYDPAAWLVHLRAPMGGLRLTDRRNPVDLAATAEGLWLHLRHPHRSLPARS